MAGGNAIRGTRIGSGPAVGESATAVPAPRVEVAYWCAAGHETRPSFATENADETPETWECRRCGLPAGLDRAHPPQPPQTQPYKTHLAYVKERRTDDDGAVLLEEALSALRERRGADTRPLRGL